jgi:GDP-4-dehydro-6-deoxy-D-mannose reductase
VGLRALITGASGFAGSHLADLLVEQGEREVWGTTRNGMGEATHLSPAVTFCTIDLTDPAAVTRLLERCRPERIYHLAAQAFVPVSWQDPWPTLENNIRAQLNLLQAMVELELEARILCVSSVEIYGKVRPEELPVSEKTALRPDSPYGVSKIAQDMLALQYFNSHGLHTVRAHPFNHIGPRQNALFVAPAFARQIAQVEHGLRPPFIEVGNLDAQRDFVDVRDVVRAYYLLLEQGAPGEAYVIGRGEPDSVRHLLDLLLACTDHEIEVRQDPARMRPSNVPISYADITKVRATTGWSPQISLEQSLRDVLADWREQTLAENG